jgi:putative serine protease PepD
MNDDLFWPSSGSVTGRGEGDDHPTVRLGDASYPASSATAAARTRDWRLPAAAAGVAALVFGGAGVGVGVAVAGNDGGATTTGAGFHVVSTASRGSVDPNSYAAIAQKVLPSVVSINVRGANEADTGSGIILRSDGYVLTNNHVVAAAVGGGRVSVVFNDGSTAPARIVGTDAEDDLAVIKVAKTGLPPATLGRSSQVRVGDPVLAIGSPLGLSGTVTSGIVSALNRPVNTTQSQQQQTDPFGFPLPQQQQQSPTVINAIQTDAAINPGNSGGPLVDARGAVIGINSAIASTGSASGEAGNIGVGFAIPIDQARIIAAELIKTGHASHPLLGVSLADATDSSGQDLARVQSVTPGGPAAKAGIKVGDIVVGVGGQQTSGADAVIAALRTHQPGNRVQIEVLRGGVRKTFTVTLADASSLSS